jgi:hypothetical protein
MKKINLVILTLALLGCKDQPVPIQSKADVSNEFGVFEILKNRKISVNTSSFMEGNEIAASSNYEFLYNKWYLDGVLNPNKHGQYFEYSSFSEHVITHGGFNPLKENAVHDSTPISRKIQMLKLRDGQANDYSSPFIQQFNYEGTFSSSQGMIVIGDTQILNIFFKFLKFEQSCFPFFIISEFAVNGFYSNVHDPFNCNGKYKSELWGELNNDSLKIEVTLKGTGTDSIIVLNGLRL